MYLLFFSIIQRGGFVSEPAILVKYNDDTSQVWSMEKLDLKLIDMRELYDELKSLDENAKALFSSLQKNLNQERKCFNFMYIAAVFITIFSKNGRSKQQRDKN